MYTYVYTHFCVSLNNPLEIHPVPCVYGPDLIKFQLKAESLNEGALSLWLQGRAERILEASRLQRGVKPEVHERSWTTLKVSPPLSLTYIHIKLCRNFLAFQLHSLMRDKISSFNSSLLSITRNSWLYNEQNAWNHWSTLYFGFNLKSMNQIIHFSIHYKGWCSFYTHY